jgi:hypothetical protein
METPLICHHNKRSTDGCTVATKPEQPIMPGKQENHNKIQYGCRSNTKTITVESNAVNYEGGRCLKTKAEVVSN